MPSTTAAPCADAPPARSNVGPAWGGGLARLASRLRRLGKAPLIPAAAFAATLLWAWTAQPAETVPDAAGQEVLIKTALLTFNDANVTGNYDVLHARMSKPFREQFTPARMKQTFRSFSEQKIDFDVIAARPPVATAEARIDARGLLQLRGFFDTRPNRVSYELDFIPSEGEWKPIRLNVSVKSADE
jgi:hypothetical protein